MSGARALVVAVALVACTEPAGTRSNVRRGRAMFALASTNAFPRPFVAVVDNVVLTVTASNGALQQFTGRLARRDSSIAFELFVPEGTTQFDARVLSASGQLLFSGTQSANLTQDNFLVQVRTTPQAPVLLVAPDTVHIAVPPRGTSQATTTVYNRGLGTLLVRFRGPGQQQGNLCAPLFCATSLTGPNGPVFADSAFIQAGSSLDVTLFYAVGTAPAPFPVTMTFGSAQGNVPVVVVTP